MIWTVSSDIIDTAPYTGAQCDNWDPMFVSCCEPDLAKWKVGLVWRADLSSPLLYWDRAEERSGDS